MQRFPAQYLFQDYAVTKNEYVVLVFLLTCRVSQLGKGVRSLRLKQIEKYYISKATFGGP